MFDSLAHPQLDTQRGEYPSFLEWKHPGRSSNNLGSISVDCDVDSPPPTPISEHPTATATTTSTARPHVVLGRGDVGGIWADLDQDFNQTLSYQEHMELPLYSFAEFLHDHPEHGEHLERPLRSTVSAYYKAYVKQIGINSNFSNYTTVTGIYHLKDLDNHCCCSIDPKLRSKFQSKPFFPKPPYNATGTACRTCASFRYAVIGYVEASPINCSGIGGQQHGGKKKTKFLIRSKTVVLATGTFDQPKKLPAVGTHPCSPPCLPTPTIQQTFHDTRQLEEWMARHNSPRIADLKVFPAFEVSPPLSPSSTSSSMLSPSLSSASTYSSVVSSASVSTLESSPAALPTPLSPASQAALPIVIVGTGLSAADAILLIQEKQPWRRIIHIYRHYSASEPSPLKRCHRDVYPEYASVWVKMKKFAMLKNSIQAYPHPPRSGSGTAVGNSGYNSIFGEKSRDACEQCQALKVGSEHGELSPLCSGCAYKGLPDSSVSSWDPLSGEITLILSHGVVIKERVAAVGVFIGKQVHMGFLKGSLAHEMLSTVGSAGKSLLHAKGIARGKSAGRRKTSGQRMLTRKDSSDLLVDIPTPPCTPPRSPVLRPSRGPLLQKQVLQPVTSHASSSSSACHVEGLQAEESDMAESNAENGNVGGNSSEDDTEEEEIDESQILTLLRPLVSDMYSFRIIPTGIPMSEMHPASLLPCPSSQFYRIYPYHAFASTQ
ncbi:Oxidative stress-induced growth inhibitor 2 [Mortierella sp. AM989]|nr:Oxidative stress-induced growth inhibitor 2 [Mortierella sp. AM989]